MSCYIYGLGLCSFHIKSQCEIFDKSKKKSDISFDLYGESKIFFLHVSQVFEMTGETFVQCPCIYIVNTIT